MGFGCCGNVLSLWKLFGCGEIGWVKSSGVSLVRCGSGDLLVQGGFVYFLEKSHISIAFKIG